ncbi:hypothetical protein [Candidatus Parabeggiatoa sp. HSG14]|uniref:hypothetical protein n=1 Tax=Candidatus Parabeggiatoa sp. HSG14 TaxID=3055593 RepID=UPI0025A720D1|nr:hypothetical protein [Thiotrichales bacterium HSG14]
MLSKKGKTKIIKLFLWGIVVVALYVGLYLSEISLIRWTAQGHWTFIVPIGIAFLFSFVHGNFTSEFWDVLNIKPKLSRRKK